MKATLLLRFETELKEKLQEISRIEKRSLTAQISKILSDYCKNYGENKND